MSGPVRLRSASLVAPHPAQRRLMRPAPHLLVLPLSPFHLVLQPLRLLLHPLIVLTVLPFHTPLRYYPRAW